MAKLYISEYVRMSLDPHTAAVPVGEEPAIAEQVVDFTSGEEKSAAFNAETRFIRMWSDTECFVTFGANPTAVSGTSPGVTAKVAEYRGLLRKIDGSALRLSVIS